DCGLSDQGARSHAAAPQGDGVGITSSPGPRRPSQGNQADRQPPAPPGEGGSRRAGAGARGGPRTGLVRTARARTSRSGEALKLISSTRLKISAAVLGSFLRSIGLMWTRITSLEPRL